jgi:DNA invertase Pin-like site-specific DNA recombinase
MCRSLRDFCNVMHYFEKSKIHVHFINNQVNTTTASGKLQASILAAMAQYSSDLTSERTREALLIKRLAGAKVSIGAPKASWMRSELALPKQVTEVRRTGVIRMYERVSSDKQYESGLGLENQTKANLRYAHQCV